jgi:hypothetical protein
LWIDRAVPAAGAKELRFFLSLPLPPTSDRVESGREGENLTTPFLVLSPLGLLFVGTEGREGGRDAVEFFVAGIN